MTDDAKMFPDAADEGAPVRAARPRPAERRAHGSEARRDDRLAEERDLGEDRELTDEDRLEAFRAKHFASILPNLPHMPGYHVCWLTTANPRDTIQMRMQMGYELLRIDAFPGWDGIGTKVGPLENVVGVNEMVAARIPRRLYEAYMRHAHHDAPAEEERAIWERVQSLKDSAERVRANLEVGDGMAALGERAPKPQFDE